jgi:uncharacterized membrane protein YqjE
MSASPPSPGGWFESLRRMGESSLALLRIRFELFTVEWQEERLRLLDLLIWISLAIAVCTAGGFLAIMLAALWLWRTTGYAGVAALAALTITAGVTMLWRLHRKLQLTRPPFEQTVAEFRKDTECLRRN